MFLLVLFLLSTAATSLGDEVANGQHMPTGHYYPPGAHGTTVCIEIRPAGHQNPTKVCGPVVHGSMQHQQQQQQQIQQTQQQRSDPVLPVSTSDTIQRVDTGLHLLEGAGKDAGPPCNRGFPRFSGPMYIPKSVGDGLVALGQPMELDNMGWRQATPPCPHEHAMRSMPPPMMAAPMLPFQPPVGVYPPNMIPRNWLTPPGFRSAEEQEPVLKGPESKEDYEHLLKECDEKTKMIKEKDMEIAELKGKVGEIKQESEKPKTVKTQNVVSQQMKS